MASSATGPSLVAGGRPALSDDAGAAADPATATFPGRLPFIAFAVSPLIAILP
jgi:hypothetical protein